MALDRDQRPLQPPGGEQVAATPAQVPGACTAKVMAPGGGLPDQDLLEAFADLPATDPDRCVQGQGEGGQFPNSLADQSGRALAGVVAVGKHVAEDMMGTAYKLAQVAFGGIKAQKQKDIQYFFLEMAQRSQDGRGDFQREFSEKIWPEDGCNDAVMQSVQAAMKTSDPKILGALAHISSNYVINDKQPDIFYRGFVGLMERIGRNEMDHLDKMCQSAAKSIESLDKHAYEDWRGMTFEDKAGGSIVRIEKNIAGVVSQVDKEAPRGLFQVVSSCALGREMSGGHEPQIHFDRESTKKFISFITGKDLVPPE